MDELNAVPVPPPLPVAPVGVVEHDVQCARCGYNVRGLSPDALCPECREPVRESLRGNLLRNADPFWLQTMQLGILLAKFWATFEMFGACAVALSGSRQLLASVISSVLAHCLTIAACLFYLAVMFLTAVDPTDPRHRESAVLRKALRGLAIARFGLGIIPIATLMSPAARPYYVIFHGICTALSTILFYLMLRSFARRVPSHGTGVQLSVALGITVAGDILNHIVPALILILNRRGLAIPQMPDLIMILVGVGGQIAGISAMIKLLGDIRAASHFARQKTPTATPSLAP